MISATIGYDVANRNNLRSKWDIGSFPVKKIESFFKEKTKPVVIEPVIELKPKQQRKERNKGFRERRSEQMPFIKEYVTWSSRSNRWANIIKHVDGVKGETFTHIVLGKKTIEDPEVWKEVVRVVNQLREEYKNESK